VYENKAQPLQIARAIKKKIQSGGAVSFFHSTFKNQNLKFPDKLMEKLRFHFFNE
jgi:hypothetical protein